MRWRVCLLGVVLAGCSTAPREWDRPWLPEPAPYEAAGGPVVEGTHPIDLPTVMRLAGANSLDVAWVREKVHEAHARRSLAVERFFPTVGPSLSYKRHTGETQGTEGNFVDVTKQQTFAGGAGTLSWQAGEAVYATLAASRRLEGARAGLAGAERAAVLDAAIAYYDLVRETRKASIAADSAVAAEKMAEEFDAAAQAGRGFRGDVLRARVRAADSRLQQSRALAAAKQASIRLVSLLRLAPGIDLTPAEEAPSRLALVSEGTTARDWIDRGLATRPEVAAAAAEAEAAGHDVDAAVYGPLVPEVSATASGGQLGPTLGEADDTADYVVSLGWKIGPGGLFDVGRRDLAASKRGQSEVELARARQRIVDEVRQAHAALLARAEQIALAEQEVRDAQEALDLNRERQKAGMGIPLEYLEAEISLARAHQDQAAALADYNQAQLRLLIQSGGALPSGR